MKIQHELANVTGGFAAGVDGGPSRPYYTPYPISYYPHYLILLPTYFMAGLQNNRGRKRRAVAVGFKLLTAAPTILPTPYPTTPTTSYYSLPTLWPAFRIIVDVDESAAPWPSVSNC